MSPSKRLRVYPLLCFLFLALNLGVYAGIPEPSLVLYGVIRGSDENPIRLTTGAIEWTFTSDSGPPVVIQGALENINDQFSYVLFIPCESPIAGIPDGPNTLKLSDSSTLYDRSSVTVNGAPAAFLDESLTSVLVDFSIRGRFDRIDLTLGEGATPTFESWISGFDAPDTSRDADTDGDGLTHWEEFKAGTDPTDDQSVFKFIGIQRDGDTTVIEWSSIAGKIYNVLRSTALLGEYSEIVSGVAATPEMNSYIDSNAVSEKTYFYRIEVQ